MNPPSVQGSSSAAGVAGGTPVDLQTLMSSVLAERSNILDGQVRSQAALIQSKNATLQQANRLLSEARVNQSQAQSLDTTQTWSVDPGTRTIHLDNGYKLTLDNKDMGWSISDKDGNKVHIWGDPHVDEGGDGKDDWDFKQDATFVLQDGTKISVGCVPYGNGMTVSDTLTITKGNQAVQVSGIASDKVSLGAVTMNGRAIDQQTNDGYLFTEKSGVDRWTSEAGTEITSDQAMGAAKTQEKVIEANDVPMSAELLQFLKENDIPYSDSDGDGKLTAAEYADVIKNIQSFTDSLTSTSQMEMTQLQAAMNKYNQTFEMMSNFIAKYSESLKTISGNIR